MTALCIYAGPKARALIQREGLQPHHVKLIPGAAGGPKGLILGPLDRFIFGDWLPRSQHTVHLVGASIGAWRMATGCLTDPVTAFERLEHDYIHQHYEPPPGQKRPTADEVSEVFGDNLKAFYGGRVAEVLAHPRYRLHIVTSRGRHLLRREHRVATPLGYLGAFLTNAMHRKAMGAWLERVVFSTGGSVDRSVDREGSPVELPFATNDYRTRQVHLTEANFRPALQASCSIPFVLRSVNHIPGAPAGAYWDGGITDYHLHLDYRRLCGDDGVVLYPHFQKNIVPGWLDKGLKWRHQATHFLDNAVVLAPHPDWVTTLPRRKLPDRKDFTHYGADLAGRVNAWTVGVQRAGQLADEFAAWLDKPDPSVVLPL